MNSPLTAVTFMEWSSSFLAFFFLDYVYARYTKATADGHHNKASMWAVGIVAFTGYATISYVGNPWMLIPCAIGAFVGTQIAVRTHKEPS